MAACKSRARAGLSTFVAYAAAAAAAAPFRGRGPQLVGEWPSWLASLPSGQLPHVPLAGNGHLGVALDSSASPRNAFEKLGVGAGAPNALDLYLNMNSYWSCTDTCFANDPDGSVPACCTAVQLGGLSLRLSPTFGAAPPLPGFAAEQRIVDGELFATFATPRGGAVNMSVRVHPSSDLLVANVSYAPGAGDPAALLFDAALWVPPSGSSAGQGCFPAAVATGCASALGVPQPCSGGAAAAAVFASRNASTVLATVMPVWGALAAAAAVGAGGGARLLGAEVAQGNASARAPLESILHFSVPAGTWAAAFVASAEARGAGALADPAPAALQAATAAATGDAGAVETSARAHWARFWNASAVSLPSRPGVEAVWWGAQYVLAAASSTDPDAVAPGLNGPWVSNDYPAWLSSYTNDYNYEAPYYGVFGSNHAELAAAYWQPVLDWLAPGRKMAAARARRANVTCAADALFFSIASAPWGLRSQESLSGDAEMAWNGAFLSLLFIGAFEYEGSSAVGLEFARYATLPLLDGLNQWWRCYLNRTIAPDGSYVYNDVNTAMMDMQHEGQPVPNPVIALSLARRTLQAQIDISRALGVAAPPEVLDIVAHFAPLPSASYELPGAVDYTVSNNTRCHNAVVEWNNVATLEACEALCTQSQPGCAAVSYCPEAPLDGCTGANNEPPPHTCWPFTDSMLPACENGTAGSANWRTAFRHVVANASNATATACAYTHAIRSISAPLPLPTHPYPNPASIVTPAHPNPNPRNRDGLRRGRRWRE